MPELETALEAKIADLRSRQLSSWEAGDRILLESLLESDPDVRANPDALLDLIYGEVLLREEFGIRPTVDEYVSRFPTCEVAIRRQFALHEAIGVLDERNAQGDPTGSTVIDPKAEPVASNVVRDGKVWREVGPYEVREELGRGGMGVVYKGQHRTTGRVAAIKLLRCEGVEDRERFLTEARAMASLRHENIVGVFEVSDPRTEEPYVALEYIEGGSLEKVIAGTPMPPSAAASLLLPLAEAIDYAHSRGVIHRDLKPANVLLGAVGNALRGVPDDARGTARSPFPPAPTGSDPDAEARNGTVSVPDRWVPKITDFGLAKRLDADSSQTRTGAILGTPSYMAPEQARGSKDVGPAVDVYGLGAILYEMLTGRPPFKGDTVMNTLAQVAEQDVVPPRSLQPSVPRDLETICLKCLEKVPTKRYDSASALASDLRRFLNGEPILARRAGVIERTTKWARRRPAAALLIAVSVTAVLGLIWFTFQLDSQKRAAKEQAIEADRQKKIAEGEREEARKQTRIAENQFIEAEKQRIEALAQSKRARHLLALSANAVDDIAMAARDGKAYEKATGNTGTVLFKLACFYARTSKVIGTDADLVADDRKTLSDQYAASAVRLLGCAQQVGYFEREKKENRERLEKDQDLAVVRSRADYKRWAARLP